MNFKKSIAAAAAAVLLIAAGAALEIADFNRKVITTADSSSANDTSSASEEEPDNKSSAAAIPEYENGVFTNGYYTITADESKWEYSAENSHDCLFSYKNDDESDEYSDIKLSVVSLLAEEYAELDPEDYIHSVEDTLALNGCEILSSKEISINGTPAHEIAASYEADGVKYLIKQAALSDEDSLAAISYIVREDIGDELQPEFDKLIESFELK